MPAVHRVNSTGARRHQAVREYPWCKRNVSLRCVPDRDSSNRVTRIVLAGKLCGQALLKVIHLSSHPMLLQVPIPADSTSFRNPLTSSHVIGNTKAHSLAPRTRASVFTCYTRSSVSKAQLTRPSVSVCL
jgi:hypothetical protein